ncbi:MAG TPA: hypothetical protein VE913_11685 [Longimicrobium sp.]|nr:hypothetical protein [Longimicrobium sp.]
MSDLFPAPGRGGFKLYVGSFAGVGKSNRMLEDAHDPAGRGVDVVIILLAVLNMPGIKPAG